MRRLLLSLMVCGLALTACGPPQPTITVTPTRSPKVTPAPTAGPDLHENVAIGRTGVGVYQLITIPVAEVTNQSSQHAALGVTVHFTPTRNGHPLQGVDSQKFTLPPGVTIAVTADCTDSCTYANGTGAAVSIDSWGDPSASPQISVSGSTFQPGSDSHLGDVVATLNAVTIPAGGELIAFAVCSLHGVVIGGGAAPLSWQTAGSPQQADVPVIVSTSPDSCQMYAAGAG